MRSGVVVGYDQTPPGERALAEAAGEADRRGVVLTVVHALHREPSEQPEQPEPFDSGSDSAETSAHDLAEQAADRVRAGHPGLTVEARTVAGPVPAVLAEQSAEAELLVVGQHGHGGRNGLHLGSVALRAVARAVCPSLVVRGSEHRTRGTVLAAVDVGHAAEEILAVAFEEAALRGARLKVVTALEAFWARVSVGEEGPLGRAPSPAAERAEDALQQFLKPWPARYPHVETDHELIEGSPTVFLTGATTYADLIVVGIHRGTDEGDDTPHSARVGPVAETLLLHSDCPVAVVPHD
ncbi:nucleotide-binding universal stress UspA family protein [Catenulispora sp. EB89]|uniref:universal stress protein n=1 Tax=Catenulispora sp. EB89 TaxID=3156257 RepID=UPI003514BCA1